MVQFYYPRVLYKISLQIRDEIYYRHHDDSQTRAKSSTVHKEAKRIVAGAEAHR